MHVGIIVYSRTGNTLSVATTLRKRLAAGHTVTVEWLETVGPNTLDGESTALKAVPPVERYDALVLATPVRGGRPAPAPDRCSGRRTERIVLSGPAGC